MHINVHDIIDNVVNHPIFQHNMKKRKKKKKAKVNIALNMVQVFKGSVMKMVFLLPYFSTTGHET